MHIVINKTPKEYFTDHINGNKLDNRKKNLRIATNQQNQANAKTWKTNTSGYRGVLTYKQDKPFAAALVFNGKRIFKGMFNTKEEAALAYNELAKQYFGRFARLNQIGGNL